MERSSTYAGGAAAKARAHARRGPLGRLRTLRNPTTTIRTRPARPPCPPESAPAPERRPVLYEAVVRRHLEARQRIGNP